MLNTASEDLYKHRLLHLVQSVAMAKSCLQEHQGKRNVTFLYRVLPVQSSTLPFTELSQQDLVFLLGAGVGFLDVMVNQDVYSGVTVSTYTPVQKTFPGQCQGYPTIVYFHGGGWTWLSVGVYDGPLKNFADRSQFKIIAVEYRKAPQSPFPAAYEDCLAVTKYVIEHTRQLNVCKELIVVAGDGAGGNLAAAVALELRRSVRLQILINPALQMLNFATPSYQDFSENSLLPGITSSEKEINNWMRYGDIHIHHKQSLVRNHHVVMDLYNSMADMIDSRKRLPVHLNFTENETIHNKSHNTSVASFTDRLILDPRFNPMFAQDVRNVADAYIIASQYDVLRDEALMYGHRLRKNGVQVELHHYQHGFHGFFLFAGGGWIEFKESQSAMDHLVKYLNRELLGLRTKV